MMTIPKEENFPIQFVLVFQHTFADGSQTSKGKADQ